MSIGAAVSADPVPNSRVRMGRAKKASPRAQGAEIITDKRKAREESSFASSALGCFSFARKGITAEAMGATKTEGRLNSGMTDPL